MPGIAARRADQHRQIAAHQRFASGDAQLADPQAGGDTSEAFDLFEVQDFRTADKLHVRLGHAVEAADVAAVGDADAQIVVEAAEGIDEHAAYFTASIRSSGSSARRMMSSASSTRG